jgi:hypothetical protein
MTVTQRFIIDVLKLMPKDSICFMDTSDDPLLDSIERMENSIIKNRYTCSFPLTEKNQNILISAIIEYHAEEEISNIFIELDGEILFMSYDGIMLGEILKKIVLPESFIKEYVEKMKICILRDKLP